MRLFPFGMKTIFLCPHLKVTHNMHINALLPMLDARLVTSCISQTAGYATEIMTFAPDYHVEDLEYRSEEAETSQAWVPLRIVKPLSALDRLPAIVYLHATGAYSFLLPSLRQHHAFSSGNSMTASSEPINPGLHRQRVG